MMWISIVASSGPSIIGAINGRHGRAGLLGGGSIHRGDTKKVLILFIHNDVLVIIIIVIATRRIFSSSPTSS